MAENIDFSPEVLEIDAGAEVKRIATAIRSYLVEHKRKGAVVAMSGGIDSSVVAALCVHALGPERVVGLLLPERDSAEETLRLSRMAADSLGIETVMEDITGALEAVGCYSRRDQAIREVIPEFGADYRCKIVLPSVVDNDSYRIFSVVAQSPEGREIKARLTPSAYLGVVAASNFKQRIRKLFEYYQADRLNYAVMGTPNRLEYDQGFFVKNGDGSADVKPIAHLYKTQVYQLAEHLGVPKEITARPPTTDTYSMPQSQEEFYFSLPYHEMDLCLYAWNNNIPAEQTAPVVGLTPEQVVRVFRDIDQKRKTNRYLHLPPQLVEEIY